MWQLPCSSLQPSRAPTAPSRPACPIRARSLQCLCVRAHGCAQHRRDRHRWRRLPAKTRDSTVNASPNTIPEQPDVAARKPAVSLKQVQNMRIGEIENVSKMGLGTWAWGNKFLWGYGPGMDPELQRIFDYATSQGVNVFDTADSYGTGALNGRSEELLGRFMRENGAIRGGAPVHIATKLAAYPWRATPWNMTAACRGSLRRLQVEQLAVGQLHWSASKYAPLQEWALVNGIADCYQQGLVKEVGVSNYGPKQLRKVHKKLADRGVKLALTQVQLSLLSWGAMQQELLATAQELGVTVIAYSPLGLGMLTGRYSVDGEGGVPAGPRGGLFRNILPSCRTVLGTLQEIAEARGVSQSQVAINWCIGKGCIPIPGAKTMAMAEDNLSALQWSLSDSEMAALDDAAARVERGMVQNIFQTA